MQERHRNHDIYFQEQAACCRKYYIPYIKEHSDITLGETCSVLEVGCGIGGGISVFAEAGCKVTGVDIHAPSIRRAEQNFASRGLSGEFKCLDIFRVERLLADVRPDNHTRHFRAHTAER